MKKIREATKMELKELEDFIVAARKESGDSMLAEVTEKSERELVKPFLDNAVIGVFELGRKNKNFDGRVLVGIWPTMPMNTSVFVWHKGKLVEFYHCEGGPSFVSFPVGD